MSQIYNIIETENELNLCKDCQLFSLENEVHLAKIVKCYDGDTIHCIFKHNNKYTLFHARMYGYDSPEMKPSTTIPEIERINIKKKAIQSREKLESLILNKNIYLICKHFDKYGRLLVNAKLAMNDSKTINDMMIEGGFGYPYFGGTKEQ